MDKHEKLDEALEKMREANAASGAATPPPDWGKLEQNVILRLVRQVKARRVVIIALSTIIVCAAAYFAAIALLLPEKEEDEHKPPDAVRWHVGEVMVTKLEPIINQASGKLGEHYWLSNTENIQFYKDLAVQLVLLPEPFHGSRWAVSVLYEEKNYLFVVKDDLEPNKGVGASEYSLSGATLASTYLVDIAKKMNRTKIWPIPTWRLHAAIKSISEGKFEMILNLPGAGVFRTAKLNYGNEAVYTVSASPWIQPRAGRANISIWNDHFAISGRGDMFNIEGGPDSFKIVEDVNWWGNDTKEKLIGMREVLNFTVQALPLSENGADKELSDKLKMIAGVIAGNPEYTQSKGNLEIKLMLKPWEWEGYDSAAGDQRDKQLLEKRNSVFAPGAVGSVDFSKLEKGVLRLTRGDISMTFVNSYGGHSTPVIIKSGEHEILKFDVRHDKPYPKLENRFDKETETIIAETAAIAREVLSKPSSTWPETTIPTPILPCWLNAIADRCIVLRTEDFKVILDSFIRWEGQSTELLLSISTDTVLEPDIELAVRNDGFSVYLSSSDSMLTCESGKLALVQNGSNKNRVLTASELRRLSACLNLLAEYQAVKPEATSANAATQAGLIVKPGIPESIKPGIIEFEDFIKNPALPEVKTAAESPTLEWGIGAYSELTRLMIR